METGSLKLGKVFAYSAIDGILIRLPNEPNIIEHFDVHNGRKDQTACAVGMTSIFYGVLNKMVIDSGIHLDSLLKKNVLKIIFSFQTVMI